MLMIANHVKQMSNAIKISGCGLLLLGGILAGHSAAAQDFKAGVDASAAGNYAEALANWLPLAKSGDPASQFNVGMMYARGDGVDKDLAEAARWFRRAAEQGQVAAQARLGAMYARGVGIEQDYMEAARWLNRAAEQHHAESQYDLAILYFNGQGVEEDQSAAYFWMSLAALQRYIPAMVGKDEMRRYLSPAQSIMVEQQAKEWLEKNFAASGEGAAKP